MQAAAADLYTRTRRASPVQPWRTEASQNIPAEVLILDDVGQLLAHVDRIYFYVLAFEVRTVEGNLFEQFLEDRMQSPSTDVLGRLVYPSRERRDLFQRILRERQLDAFRIQQRLILLHQRVLGLFQNPNEISLGQ